MRMKNIQGTNHLAPQRLKSQSGSRPVSEGQEIAKVGMTGYTFHPHLHFQVFIFTGTHSWIDFDTGKCSRFYLMKLSKHH